MNNVFRNKNFCLVFLDALVSELGTIMYNFAVSFYILEITGNNAFLQGLYLALCGIAMVVTTPIGGVLGDRFNKAKIMYICDYVKGGNILISTLFLVLSQNPPTKIVILFVMGVIGNIVSGIFTPASNSIFPHIVDESQLQQANSYFAMKTALEGIVGVVLAGILYAAFSFHIILIVVGSCYILSAISEMFIRYEHQRPKEELTIKLALNDMNEGFNYLKNKKGIMAFLCAMLFINFFYSQIMSNFVPFFIKTELAKAPSYLFDNVLKPELWASIFNFFFGISLMLAAAVLSSRAQMDRCGKKSAYRICVMAVAIILLSVSYSLLVQTGRSINAFLIIYCIVSFVVGSLVSSVNIPTNTAIMRIVDINMLSKVNCIISVGSQGMIPIGNVIAGIILKELGCAPLLILCSVGFTVTALLLVANKNIEEF